MSNSLVFTRMMCGESGVRISTLIATHEIMLLSSYRVLHYGFNVGRWFRLPHVSQIFHLAYCNDCFLVFFFGNMFFSSTKTCFLFLTALENMLTSGTGWIQNLIYFFNSTKVLFLKMRCFIILEFNDGAKQLFCEAHLKLFQIVNPPLLNS